MSLNRESNTQVDEAESSAALQFPPRHCEERSDEAIQCGASALDYFASLAMTVD
jgi:hypothetical protein